MKIEAMASLFALVAALVLGEAGAAAAAARGAALSKPAKCSKVPGIKFQAAATSMLMLCPEPKEGSCPDDCVSALTTLDYECSMAVAVAHANSELKDAEAAVEAIQGVWERCLTNQEMALTKGVRPPVLKPRVLAESPDGAPPGKITKVRLMVIDEYFGAAMEVRVGGDWGWVCADAVGRNEANVACRQLGYSGGEASSWVQDLSSSFVVTSLNCNGDKSELSQCGFTTNDYGACNNEFAILRCNNGPSPSPSPSPTYTPTPNPTPTPTPTPTTSTPTAVPSAPSSPSSSSGSSSSGSSGGSSVPIGAIVGGVVGGILAIAAVAGGVYYAQRQRALRMARSPADKWLDGAGAGHFSPPPPNDPEAPTGGAPRGGPGGGAALAGAGGGAGAAPGAGAGAGAAAALAGVAAVAAAGTPSEREKQGALTAGAPAASAPQETPHNEDKASSVPVTLPSGAPKATPSNLQDTFISGTPALSAPKETPRSVLQDTFITPPRPAAPPKGALNGGAQDTLISPASTPDAAEAPPVAAEGEAKASPAADEGKAEPQAAPATKEMAARAPQAAIPPEVATASTSTAALPETPSGPQSRSLVQSLASRSTHSSATNSKLMSQDVLLSYIAKQRTLPAVAPEGALQPRGSSGVNVAPWEVSFDELVMIEPVGEGSFGRVYMADFHSTTVAVKVLIDKEAMANAGPKEALSLPGSLMAKLDEEASLLASLRHPCVVQFMGVCREPPCIITEYCPKGNLTAVLMAAKRDAALSAELTWRRRLGMALDAARGMVYLHTRTPPIIHRDLKSPNLLVDDSYHCKVSDFNLSRFVEENMGTKSSSMAAMNPRWLAPEVMKGERATPAADTYSFGIVMWELLTWELPWSTTGPWQLVNLLMNGGHLEVPPREELPGTDTPAFEGLDAYIALMKRCWAQNQYDRPAFEEITRELRSLLDSAP